MGRLEVDAIRLANATESVTLEEGNESLRAEIARLKAYICPCGKAMDRT